MKDAYAGIKEQLLLTLSVEFDNIFEKCMDEIKKVERGTASNSEEFLNWKQAYNKEKRKNDLLLSLISCHRAIYLNEQPKVIVKGELKQLLETAIDDSDETIISLTLETYLMIKKLPTYFDRQTIKTFASMLIHVLKTPLYSNREEIYSSALALLINFGGNQDLRKEILVLLSSSYQEIKANVWSSSDIVLIVKYLSLCTIYNLECSDVYENLLTELHIWIKKFNEILFLKLLWYGVILKQDKSYIEAITNSSDYLSKNNASFKIYKDIYNDKENKKELINRINDLQYFTIVEKQRIKEAVSEIKTNVEAKVTKNMKVANVPVQSSSNSVSKKTNRSLASNSSSHSRKLVKVFKIDFSNLPNNIKRTDLQLENFQLAVFPNTYVAKPIKYIKVTGYSVKGSGPVYVDDIQLKEIRVLSTTYWVEVIDQFKRKPETNTKKTLREHDNNNHDFNWPSTDVNKIDNNVNEDVQLNDKSDLRKLGYQITNSNRNDRWNILQSAVKSLGLRKVAFTIASNVRLRKGQKNGTQKFSYSISEWEYDLRKLKEKYYKHDFSWPKT